MKCYDLDISLLYKNVFFIKDYAIHNGKIIGVKFDDENVPISVSISTGKDECITMSAPLKLYLTDKGLKDILTTQLRERILYLNSLLDYIIEKKIEEREKFEMETLYINCNPIKYP